MVGLAGTQDIFQMVGLAVTNIFQMVGLAGTQIFFRW
jgi:hypothetical protein